ncbi:MAG: S49 family peptidase [Deltaproteobacteria bacterium]|nr:S49 family peptidase [Deltaproteobacteria bacterium]
MRHAPRWIFTALPFLLLPSAVSAQTELRVPAPPAPVEGEYEGAESVLWNPALLADARVWQVAYLHRQQLGTTQLGAGSQGDAFFAAVPVFGPLALSAGVGVGYPADSFDLDDGDAADRMWGMVALGTSLRLGSTFALGLLYRGYLADTDPFLDGWNTLDAGFTFRPWRWLGMSFAASDLFEPRSDTSRGAMTAYERRYLVDLSARPLGDDFLTIGASFRAGETSGRMWLGAGAAIRPVEGLAIRGRFDARMDGCGDGACFSEWQVGTAVELSFPWATIGGGVGFAEHGSAADAVDVVARLTGGERPALARSDRIVAFRWTGGLGEGDWVQLVRWTEALRRDGDVAGVLLVLDGFSGSTGDIQELRGAIASLQHAGKPVWCSYDDAPGAVAYLCGAADHTIVAPGGGSRLTGIRTRLTFFRRLLDRLGIQAEIVKVGAYKSAPESFTEDSPSPEHQESLDAYLDDVYGSMTADLAGDLGLDSPAEAAALIDRGPFTAPELVEAGLAGEAAFADEARDIFQDAVDADIVDAELDEPPPGDGSTAWGRRPSVVVVRIDGSMIDGKSLTIPLIDIRMVGDRTVVELLDKLRTDPAAAAVVLRIDSGGGSAIAADNIWRAAMRVRAAKPLVAAIGPIGASAAYYVAAAAKEIYVLPASLTGSIGIFYGKANIGDFLLDLGISTYEEGRGARASMESWTRPYTEDELAVLQEKINFYYWQFVERVVEGRAGALTTEQVDAIGQGRIWSGAKAVELGLADTIGGLGDAVARAKALAGLPDDAPVIDAEAGTGGLLSLLLGALADDGLTPVAGLGDSAAEEDDDKLAELLLQAVGLDGTLASVVPFLFLDGATPMALCPYVFEPRVE